ncbi:MAG TPA: ABC transporter permease, partial [Acidobacteriota bacterium]
MNIRESVVQSLDNLAKRKLRSLLTMIGIIFGVGAVISMLSIGAGAQDQALKIIRQMGLHNVIVEGKEFDPEDLRKVREKSLGLSRRDFDAVLQVTPNIRRGSGKKNIKTYQVFSGDHKVESRVIAVDAAYFGMGNLDLLDGAFFDKQDEAVYSQVCVLGAKAKQGLFGFESALGKSLKVNNAWFTVVGVMADQSLSQEEFQ